MLTNSQIEQRSIDILNKLVSQEKPKEVWAAVSGGNDSLFIATIASQHPNFCGVFHIDTGIELEVTKKYVDELCASQGWNLQVYKARENLKANGVPDPKNYENFVRKLGFPTNRGHSLIFQFLKERQIHRFVRDRKQSKSDRICLISGVRKDESKRRLVTVSAAGEIDRRGSTVWGNIASDVTTEERDQYIKWAGIPQNPLKTEFGNLLGHSGDCTCMAVGGTGEWEIQQTLFPDDPTTLLISQLEKEVQELGFPWGPGGEIPEWWGKSNRKTETYRRWQAAYESDTDSVANQNMCGNCNKKCALREEKPILTGVRESVNLSLQQVAVDPIQNLQALAQQNLSAMLPMLMQGVTYFPITKGMQGGKPFYAGAIKLAIVSKLFQLVPETIADQDRWNRPLNENRAELIGNYILEGVNDPNPREDYRYVLGGLTVAVSPENTTFHPLIDGLGFGFLSINSMTLKILDGQHRKRAIDLIIYDHENLGTDSVTVTFYTTNSLKEEQSIFSVQNRRLSKPNASTNKLFDHGDLVTDLTQTVRANHLPFKTLTALHEVTPANNSLKLFSFNNLYDANKALMSGSSLSDFDLSNYAIAYWKAVSDCIPHWEGVMRQELKPAEVRNNYIHHLGISLIALGRIGAKLQDFDNWESIVLKLRNVDWSRQNADFTPSVLNPNGTVARKSAAINALTAYLEYNLGISDGYQPSLGLK